MENDSDNFDYGHLFTYAHSYLSYDNFSAFTNA